jgi:hypothetical protein
MGTTENGKRWVRIPHSFSICLCRARSCSLESVVFLLQTPNAYRPSDCIYLSLSLSLLSLSSLSLSLSLSLLSLSLSISFYQSLIPYLHPGFRWGQKKWPAKGSHYIPSSGGRGSNNNPKQVDHFGMRPAKKGRPVELYPGCWRGNCHFPHGEDRKDDNMHGALILLPCTDHHRFLAQSLHGSRDCKERLFGLCS